MGERGTEEYAIDVSTSQTSQEARERGRTSRACAHPALLLAASSAPPARVPLVVHCVLDAEMHPAVVDVAPLQPGFASRAAALLRHVRMSLHALS